MDFPSEYKYADAYVDSGKDDYVGPADVVGATLDDYKVGVGYVTSNNKDMPVTGIQTLRPYIPNPATLDGWGSIGVATRGAFGRLGTSDTSSLYLDPRYQEVDYGSVSRTVFGFPEIADTASMGVYGESSLPAKTSLWGQPGMMQVAGL
eukprot:jgi/Mesvir1/12724/Mv22473-RA.1